MPIANDPLNRKWLDVSSVNPDLVDQFRPTTVSILGFDSQKNPKFWGTGFIIAGNEHFAIILTAKHVLEGVQRFQKPNPKHVLSALSEFIVQPKVSINPSDLRIVWAGQKEASMMTVVYVFYSEHLDMACCIVIPQKIDTFLPFSVPLDFRIPPVGSTVQMISCLGMSASETTPPSKQDGLGQVLKIKRSVNIRIGRVTGVYKGGFNQYKFPCFTTSIPAEPGMSGGFVYIPEDGDTIAACGLVSVDFSTKSARESMLLDGDSLISCVWPALGFSIPEGVGINEATPKITIFDMIKAGRMPAYNNDVEQFEISKLEGDDYRVQHNT